MGQYLNVGLDNMKLKLAPPDNNAPYVAMFHAVSDLANGIVIVAGGVLLERLAVNDSQSMQLYTTLFIAGWLGRTAAAALAATLIEPGAKRLRDLV